MEQELQDLFKEVGVAWRRAELNQSGKDLTTDVELIDNEGNEVKFVLNIEIKSNFGDNAEMYKAPLKFESVAGDPNQGQEVFRDPNKLIEKAIKRASGNVPLEELHRTPVPDDVIRLLFREKFDDYDMFYVKDGFWSTQAIESQGIFYYRYRYYVTDSKSSKHQLLICLKGLENGDEDKMGYAELAELFNDEFIEKGKATFKEMLDKSLELVII